MLEDACRAVIAGLQPLSEEELNKSETFTWLGGRSVARLRTWVGLHPRFDAYSVYLHA